MSYARKNLKNIVGAIFLMIAIASVETWQFYEYATFESVRGIVNASGGTSHLVWSILLAGVACGIGFLVFSVFLQHDTDDELHVTVSTRRRRANSHKNWQ